jgi:transcriptional regulator GlxA family with amidase domain
LSKFHAVLVSISVPAVGNAVGYDSPSQFSREYRSMFGVPPSRRASTN